MALMMASLLLAMTLLMNWGCVVSTISGWYAEWVRASRRARPTNIQFCIVKRYIINVNLMRRICL